MPLVLPEVPDGLEVAVVALFPEDYPELGSLRIDLYHVAKATTIAGMELSPGTFIGVLEGRVGSTQRGSRRFLEGTGPEGLAAYGGLIDSKAETYVLGRALTDQQMRVSFQCRVLGCRSRRREGYLCREEPGSFRHGIRVFLQRSAGGCRA